MTFPSLKQSRGLLVVSYLQSPAGHRQKNNQVNPAEQSRAFASSWLSPSLLCTARVNQAALHEAALPWEGGGVLMMPWRKRCHHSFSLTFGASCKEGSEPGVLFGFQGGVPGRS